VLSIGKIRLSGERYYLAAVADGVDEYYRGVGEAPGRWVGDAAVPLGLDDEVAPEDLGSIWSGRDPRTGEPLGRFIGREIAGFDLTFRAPKSVSLLFALGDSRMSAEVRDAHEVAVDAALGYVEREAARSRTGRNGVQQIEVNGIVAAAFRHRTSRAGDPHLHTHVLVANMAEGPDGRWRTLDGRSLYQHAKTAGYLYEAELRAELTRRLGVEWGPVGNGIADLDGIPAAVLRQFSERRRQIEEHLDETGFRSARAAELAALETRQAKTAPAGRTMRSLWLDKAYAMNWDPERLHAVVDRAAIPEPVPGSVPDLVPELVPVSVPTELFDLLSGPGGLTAQASTFDRRDVLRALAERAPRGASVRTIEALADEFLTRPDIVSLTASAPTAAIRRTDGSIIPSVATQRWSTTELIALESRLVRGARSRVGVGAGLVPTDIVEGRIRGRENLTAEQAEMLTRLCLSGNGVDVVTAAAGTGKTYTLNAVNLAWRHAGYDVIGAAVAGIAAQELQSSAGIPSTTLAMLSIELENGRRRLDNRTVLVIDEAGMAGTRTLAPILDAAHWSGAKVVLVGDPRQLPEIDAGGVLAGLARRLDPIELIDNRRQRHDWERHALAELRHGDVSNAFAAYHDHDRIVTSVSVAILRDRLLKDWWNLYATGDSTVMLAHRRIEVDDLNGRARAHLQRAGHLTGPEIIVNDRPFQTGDHIVCLRNDRRLGIHNGTRATITHLDPDQRAITIRTGQRDVVLPARYLDGGHLAHGYATTIHKAQGATVDHALLLGSDDLTRESGYVALSRGRHTNRIYITGDRDPGIDLSDGPPEPGPNPTNILRLGLQRSSAKQLAIDTGQPEPAAPMTRKAFEPPAVEWDITDELF
jgi:conjugative relaxase-like TrwC/TraI family protein